MAFKKISHDGVIYDVDIQGGGGTGAVNSVNGKQGDVVLTGADIKTNTGATVNAAIAGKQNMLTAEEKQAIADMHQDAVTSVNGQTGAVTVPASEPYDDTEIRNEIAGLNRDLSELDLKKMEYKILTFTGSAFTLDGETLTFSQIKDLCLNAKDFVYAQYSNRLYVPAYVSNSNIFFEASYIDSDIPQMHRISINSSNQVSQFSFNLAKTTQIPTALPTPNALTFTGGATGTFDGSEPLSINIPTGGGGGSDVWEYGGEVPLSMDTNLYEIAPVSEFRKILIFKIRPAYVSTLNGNTNYGFTKGLSKEGTLRAVPTNVVYINNGQIMQIVKMEVMEMNDSENVVIGEYLSMNNTNLGGTLSRNASSPRLGGVNSATLNYSVSSESMWCHTIADTAKTLDGTEKMIWFGVRA